MKHILLIKWLGENCINQFRNVKGKDDYFWCLKSDAEGKWDMDDDNIEWYNHSQILERYQDYLDNTEKIKGINTNDEITFRIKDWVINGYFFKLSTDAKYVFFKVKDDTMDMYKPNKFEKLPIDNLVLKSGKTTFEYLNKD